MHLSLHLRELRCGHRLRDLASGRWPVRGSVKVRTWVFRDLTLVLLPVTTTVIKTNKAFVASMRVSCVPLT